jgi:trk system potassium uptake protein TrkA
LGDKLHDKSVLVVGLGRFGGALALALSRLGHEVLAIDTIGERVQEFAGDLTHVMQVDATSETALRQIGAPDLDVAVVAIGSDIEASVLATSALMDIGVKQVWAKAITEAHGRILHRIGAHHVVFPEADAGERVAHLLSGKMIDFIEFDDDFAIVKTRAPVEAHGRTLGESKLRAKYGVTIVGVKRPGGDFTPAQASTTVEPGDILIIAGATKAVEKFAAIT